MSRRVGVVGLSEGNGHPFSFSAIINGYDDAGLAASGWPGIHAYVRQRDRSEFGIDGLTVTHAWTQDPAITAALCSACKIPNAAPDLATLAAEVDAVIIARDDHESHYAMAMPLLEMGLPVFVDKPLTVDPGELTAFRPYLESGQLVSCSGMRFARELDAPRATLADYGELKLIRGAILNDWEKYGVHLVDAVFNLTPARPVAVTALPARHSSLAVELDDGVLLQLDALGTTTRCFRIDIFGERQHSTHEIVDNFSMFRRLLACWARGLEAGAPPIPPADTLDSMRLLMMGRRALNEQRKVKLDEFPL